MSETRYQCTECGAEDRDHQPYTPPPAALICWNGQCKAGSRMSVTDQVKASYGMLPKREEIN